MKNIIFLTQLSLWSMDNKKGAPSFYKTIEAYLNDNWNVALIHPDYKNQINGDLERINSITFKPIFHALLKIKKIGIFSRVAHSLYGSHMLFKLGEKTLKKYNYNAVIYAYEVHGVKAGKKLKNKYKVPLIARFQGTVLADIDNTLKNRIKKYPHFQALSEGADLLIMTNDGTRGLEVLKTLNNSTKNVCFWRNGVDIKSSEKLNEEQLLRKKTEFGLSFEDKILITVSRLASWKRVDRAISALAEVIKQKPECKLIIIGDGEEKKSLINMANSLGLSSNIIFKGALLQTEVRDYMNIADIFLSLYDLSNLGNPIMEAMSCGKAIITLDVGDTYTIIENGVNGILIKPDEVDKIPDYIIKILNDTDLKKQLEDSAREFAHKEFWSWQERMQTEMDEVNKLNNDFVGLKK